MATAIPEVNTWALKLAVGLLALAACAPAVADDPAAAKPAPPPEVLRDKKIAFEKPMGSWQPQATEEQKQQAAELVGRCLAAMGGAPEPAPGVRARIDKLIGDLGADEWLARENASRELVKIGRPALPALRAALGNRDAEIAARAREAVAAIEKAALQPLIDELKKMPMATHLTIQGQIDANREAWTKAGASAAAAEKAGRKDEAEQFRAAAKAAGERISALDSLYWLILPDARLQGLGLVK